MIKNEYDFIKCIHRTEKAMTDEELYLQKRFKELGEKSWISSQFFFTGFLSVSDISLLHETCDRAGIRYTLWGGAENAERRMARFGDVESIGYEIPFPIVILHVSPLLMKFADEFNHRDFLGAIMNLGIKRETVGDILVKDKEAYIFAEEKIADYIIENLDKVKHTHVKVEKIDGLPEQMETKKVERELLVSSTRLDVIVAGRYKMSRNQALLLFRGQKVFVNGRVCENNSYQVRENDVISVRGFGKMEFKNISGETRKGRVYVTILDYQ